MSDTAPASEPTPGRRARLSQEDVPGYSIDQALRVAKAIGDNYAYAPTRPLAVAEAMGVRPSSGGFRGVTGAAVAYGLTTGAYNSAEIGITPLGLRIVRPTTDGDDLAARREALLKPRVIGEFLRQYDGAALPSDTIARNVLQEKGVPTERLDDVLGLILDSAASAGLLKEITGRRYVDLSGTTSTAALAVSSPDTVTSPTMPTPIPSQRLQAPQVSVGAGVNINIEIHIAADASAQTIEDIFKNMSRYVLRPDSEPENDE